MKKLKNFKILLYYLRDDKFKIFIYIFLVLMTYFPALLAAFLWGRAVELMLVYDYKGFFITFLIWSLIFILCYSVLQIPRDKLYNYFEIKFMKNVSNDLYHKINNLPSIAFEDIGVGEFVNRLYNDTDRIMSLLNSLIKLVCKSFVVIIVLGLSFYISWILGLEILLFAVSMAIISWKYFPKIKETQEKIKKESDNYVKTITENITGIREIKSLGIKKNMELNVNNRLNNLFTNEKKIRNYEVWYYSLNNLAYFVLQFTILATAAYFFVHGKIVYALFSMLDSYIWRIDEVVESLATFGVDFNKVTVSLKRIDEIINNKLYQDEKFGDKCLTNPKGEIEFKNVYFKYKKDEDYTLKNFNLKIDTNKKIAIVGRSGNGKSTLFNLLLRYFDVTKGSITIDGININDLSEEELRKNISIIRQSPFLFNMSIFDNFKLVRDDITLDEVRDACKKSYIDEYIMSLPKGYDTIIGEGGVNLSGGQKQRIAIARTLILDTKIILFDEATSALDNESQEYIKMTIDNLIYDHTIIIVAHRLSTIVDADIIHVVNEGQLESSGTHKELLDKSKVYQRLYANEKKEI